MKKNDLLDTELSETPTEALRGVRAIAVPLIAVAVVTASGCSVEVIGRVATDAGTDAQTAYDAGRVDAPVTVVDAGIYVADSGGDAGP